MGHGLDNELATPGFAVGLTTDCTTGPVLIFSGNLQVLIFECSKFRISEILKNFMHRFWYVSHRLTAQVQKA